MQDWIVRRQLLGTPGVADVSSFGGHAQAVRNRPSTPSRLRALDVTMDEVYQAAGAEQPEHRRGLPRQATQRPTSSAPKAWSARPHDIGNIVVRNTASGLPVLVRDVADGALRLTPCATGP